MRYLSDDAINKAVGSCILNPRYNVGVAVFDSGTARITTSKFEYVIDSSRIQEDISRIYKQTGSSWIEFKNGSTIRIFTASGSSRGNAFHEIIVDDKINKEIVGNVLIPTEKIQYKNPYR